MKLLEQIKQRERQVTELGNTVSPMYAKLKIAYETQHIELLDYKQKANYWEVQFSQIKTREQGLQSELEDTRALLKKREQQLFGRRSEKSSKHSEKKILKSLKNHWDGLTVFVNEPSIPMDNNLAERGLRGPILGRNGYYGSGAVWSSALSAMMFTICKTLHLANTIPIPGCLRTCKNAP